MSGRFLQSAFATLLLLASAIANAPSKPLTPTESVVSAYLSFVRSGALLTPEGYSRAMELAATSKPFPENSTIHLESGLDAIMEDSISGNTATVWTKWGDYYGTIDSRLHYEPPATNTYQIPTAVVWHVVLTNRHQYLDAAGKISRESSGAEQWKIADKIDFIATDPQHAIDYVKSKASESKDPKIKANATATLKVLRRILRDRGSNCAC